MMVRYLSLLGVLAVAGCQTVSNPFVHMAPDYSDVPVPQIEEMAHAIEAAVAAGEREFTLPEIEGLAGANERVVQAVRTRIARSELVGEFLDSGFAWERNNGLIAIIRSREYKKARNRREKDRDALLIVSENQDRWAIYEGIVKANNLSPRSLSAIQELFYKARVDILDEGSLYETPDGERVAK